MLELIHTSPWAWTTLCLLLGLIVGGLQAGGWRLRLSNDLLGEQQRLRLLETKSEHQRFGISDLKLRIRLSQRESALLRTDLKLLRSTYAQLDDDLRVQWDTEINHKSALATLQADVARLQSELADWKARLSKLQEQLDEGAIDEAQLKKELTLGITAVCEHNNPEMSAVQELLRDCASQIDEQTITREPQKVIGLLAAKVELLEGQIIYWQNLVITSPQAGLAPVNDGLSDSGAEAHAQTTDVQPNDAPNPGTTAETTGEVAANHTDEPTLGEARNVIAEKSKQAHGPVRGKRKRRSRRKTGRAKKIAANNDTGDNADAREQKDGSDDATELSQQV